MISALLALLRRSFLPTRTILMWVLLISGLLLASFNAYRTITARRAATLDRAAFRVQLLDSVARAGELNARRTRQKSDSIITREAARLRDRAEHLRLADETNERRYNATRVALPAY